MMGLHIKVSIEFFSQIAAHLITILCIICSQKFLTRRGEEIEGYHHVSGRKFYQNLKTKLQHHALLKGAFVDESLMR
jgi:hypothetical protein